MGYVLSILIGILVTYAGQEIYKAQSVKEAKELMNKGLTSAQVQQQVDEILKEVSNKFPIAIQRAYSKLENSRALAPYLRSGVARDTLRRAHKSLRNDYETRLRDQQEFSTAVADINNRVSHYSALSDAGKATKQGQEIASEIKKDAQEIANKYERRISS